MAGWSTKTLVLAAFVLASAAALAKLLVLPNAASSAFFSSTVQSLVEASFLGLLWFGLHRLTTSPSVRGKRADSRDLYFWSFAVATLLYSMGAGLALHDGVERLARPTATMSPPQAMFALGLGAALSALTLLLSLSSLRNAREGASLLSPEPKPHEAPLIAVLAASLASLVSQFLALAALLTVLAGDEPRLDPLASVALGLVMTAVAAAMAMAIKRVVRTQIEIVEAIAPLSVEVAGADEQLDQAVRPAILESGAKSDPFKPVSGGATGDAQPGLALMPQGGEGLSKPSGLAGKPQIQARHAGRKRRGKRRH